MGCLGCLRMADGDFIPVIRSIRKAKKTQVIHIMLSYYCRVPKGGVFKGGGNWGTLRIPFGKIGEP